MSVANIAMDLIRSVKRSPPHRLAPYEDDKVRRCMEEMRKLYEENRQDVLSLRLPSQSSSSTDDSAALIDSENIVQAVVIRHATMERVKRCLLAYHHARLMQIKEIRWQYGAGVPKAAQTQFYGPIMISSRQYFLGIPIELGLWLSSALSGRTVLFCGP
ncbi:unnamed protein product [Hydatigera taeniaeformis]|uniref:DNA replication complex GINS protein PSF1 n=1 Tax=Hydatigena taeniaeformis TaxID=6205 RepID=A0A0R3WQG0_HYDTA|nr:unnamed protein product [Hydatigera taeniaeformis]